MKPELPEWAWETKEKSYMEFSKPLDNCHTTLLMTTEVFKTLGQN